MPKKKAVKNTEPAKKRQPARGAATVKVVAAPKKSGPVRRKG
jgi:hypothetical protein